MSRYFLARLLRTRRGPTIAAAGGAVLAIAVGVTIFAVASNDDAPSTQSRTREDHDIAANQSTTTRNNRTSPTAHRTRRTTTTSGDSVSTTVGTGTGSQTTSGPGTLSTTIGPANPGAPTTTLTPTATDLETKYLAAWKAECRRIWAFSPNGKMYDPDDASTELSLGICLESMDSVFMTATTAVEATEQGRQDARTFLYDSTVSGLVCWIDPSTEAIVGCYDAETDTTGPLTVEK